MIEGVSGHRQPLAGRGESTVISRSQCTAVIEDEFGRLEPLVEDRGRAVDGDDFRLAHLLRGELPGRRLDRRADDGHGRRRRCDGRVQQDDEQGERAEQLQVAAKATWYARPWGRFRLNPTLLGTGQAEAYPTCGGGGLPRRRQEVSEPVEELKWGELDDAVGPRARGLPPAPRADPVRRPKNDPASGEHVADFGDAVTCPRGWNQFLS